MADAAEAPLAADAFYRRLPEYLARVRLDGLAVGAEQESRLFLLLSRLESAGAMPDTVGALARLVVPVFAGTPTQQAMCHDHFRAMFSEVGADLDESESPLVSGEGEEQKTWLWRILRTGITRAVAALVIVLTIALVVLAVQTIDRRPVNKLEPRAEVTAVPADRKKLLLQWIRDFPIKELELPEQRPWNRTLRWYYAEFGWQKSAAAALPWLIYAAAFGGLVYLTLAHLRRESLRQNLRTLPLSFRGDRPRFGDRALLADLQPLRSLSRDEIREIDPEAMAVATAEQGGLMTPRWRTRPVPADFVVLIDRRSPRDHLASYGEAMVETLRSAGIFVEQFDFDRSPWACRRRRSGEIETLSSVLGGFPGAVFLFFISESELLNAGSGAPKAWIGEIDDVARSFLVVPEAASGVLDRALPGDLMVAHASPAGLRAVAARLLAHAAPDTASDAAPAMVRLVGRINERADRWMQAAPPPTAEIDGLVAELQRTAGAETYRWIAATSVYPELRWPMTLYLRDRVGGNSGQPAMLAPDILGVAQLPWFRRGWMPDWVRTRLLKRLSATEQHKVRSLLLEAMGITPATRPLAAAMEVSARNPAGAPPAERIRSDRILVDYLLPSLASANQFFALPEEWAKKIARRPLRRLAIAAVCGGGLAAVGSFGTLALMPIDECDLWGGTAYSGASGGMGPETNWNVLARGGNTNKVISACKAAMERAPDNLRYRFQYARALVVKPDITASEIEVARRALFELDQVNHVPAINRIGIEYLQGVFAHDNLKAAEYFEKAYRLGGRDAGANLAFTYQRPEFNNSKYYQSEMKRLFEESVDRGMFPHINYVRLFRTEEFGFKKDEKKYVELIKLGVDREYGPAAVVLGDLYANGKICDGCPPDYESANKYYLKAIEWDADPAAAARLAENYFWERGVERNVDQALYWAIFAARVGQPWAVERAVDLIYEIVATTEPAKLAELGLDLKLIVGHLRASAESGNEHSQFYFGRMLEAQGNIEQALVWYRKASDQGLQQATDAVGRLSSE